MATNIVLRSEAVASGNVILRRIRSISGVTRNSIGAVLPSVAVHLFRTSDDLNIADDTSDPTTGAYTFFVPSTDPYYVAGFKNFTADDALRTADTGALTADVSVIEGVTANTLIGV